MKLVLSEKEVSRLLVSYFPPSWVPPGHGIVEIEQKGYPAEFIITIGPQEEAKEE